jgi:hypothetical protein
MKTEKQIAQELHDKLLTKYVELDNEIEFLRLEQKDKEKEKAMIERDNLETRFKLLEKRYGL